MTALKTVRLMAGIPDHSESVYWNIRFGACDPAVVLDFQFPCTITEGVPGAVPEQNGLPRLLILRDIEVGRASKKALVSRVACPAQFAPSTGLSGDRETATAQSAAEALRRYQVERVIADRSLPFIYVKMIQEAGIKIECDLDYGISGRRSKDAQEIEAIRESQHATEAAVKMACQTIGQADVRSDGVLLHEGTPLTSERVRAMIDHFLLDRGYANVPAIVAGRKDGGDCHAYGTGELRTGEPVIIDVFPISKSSKYSGDCTRTSVNGAVPEQVQKMYDAVVAAKKAAMSVIRAGVSGETVHQAVVQTMLDHGFNWGFPPADAPDTYISLTHGTGHGVGLSVHEPPLLDYKGPVLVSGDAVTVEPGLYSVAFGGVRSEDIVIVTENGCYSLNELPETLSWA